MCVKRSVEENKRKTAALRVTQNVSQQEPLVDTKNRVRSKHLRADDSNHLSVDKVPTNRTTVTGNDHDW